MTDPLLAPADTKAVGLIAHDLRTQSTDGVTTRP
jgi:hypothetical protein